MKKIIISYLLIFLAFSAGAQELGVADSVQVLKNYKFSDNWFISAQIGANHAINENARFGKFFKMTGPSAAVSVGKFFSPAVGFRLQGVYDLQHSRINSEIYDAYPQIVGNGIYKFNSVSVFLDGMFNLFNVFAPYKESRVFNLFGIVGVGATHSFGFDKKIDSWTGTTESGNVHLYPVSKKNHTNFGVRVGLQGSFRVSNSVDLTIEALATGTDDQYNGMSSDRVYDAWVSVLAGVTYRFKNHDGTRQFTYVTLTNRDQIDALNAEINAQRARIQALENQPLVVTEVEKEVHVSKLLDMTVSFDINKYNITKVQVPNVAAVAQYLKDHPNENLAITGYADVNTGTFEINQRLAKQRAEAVYNMLVDKYKVSPSRIRVDSKGDTVQPYSMDYTWNRVVVFVTEPGK